MGLSSVLPEKAGFGRPKSPRMEERYPGIAFSQFTGAEMMAKKYGLSKDELDEFGYQSHQKAIAAAQKGLFEDEIVPVAVTLPDGSSELHKSDEGIRFDASLEAIKAVKLLQEGGRITAATSSQICDGASGVMVVNERGLKTLGIAPMARIHAMTVIGHDPVIMLEAPIPATARALKKAGMSIDDIDLFEVNEAFASVPVAWLKKTEADPQKLNVHGGARRVRHQADDDAGLCAEAPRQALGPADHVRRRRTRQRHHRRADVSAAGEWWIKPPCIAALRPSTAPLRQAQGRAQDEAHLISPRLGCSATPSPHPERPPKGGQSKDARRRCSVPTAPGKTSGSARCC